MPDGPSVPAPLLPAPGSRTLRLTGVLLVVLSAIAFSAKAVMAKLAYRHGVDAIQVLALRMGFSLPVYLAVLVYQMRREREPMARADILKIIALGVLGYYLASLFDFLGLEHISAGLERLILFTYPTLVAMMEVFFFKRRLGRTEIVALALTYAGIAVVFRSEADFSGKDIVFGALLVFASAVTYAAYLVGSGRLIPRVGAERFTALALTVSCLSVLLHTFVSGHSLKGLPGPVYELGFWLAMGATVAPTFLLAWAIRRIGSGPAAIAGTVGPVATIALANIFLGEPIHTAQLVGAALVIAGATLIAVGGQGGCCPPNTCKGKG